MSQGPKGGPTSKKTTFSFRQVPYTLPHMKAAELTMLQPDDLMAKLSNCNARLPPKKASLEFISAAFNVLFNRIRGGQREAKWRQVKRQWKVNFGAYKSRSKKRKSSRAKVQQKAHTPGIQQSVEAYNKENVIIDSQDWWISRRYKRNFQSLGLHNFGSNFISINQNHPREDFTPRVLMQAYDAYVNRAPNISSEIRQEMMHRKNSKRAQAFLLKCGRRAAAAEGRAEREAAACSADSSSNDGGTETDGTETRGAGDSSAEDTEDDMQEIVPAAASSTASTSVESQGEGQNPVQSSSEDEGDSSSITTSSETESETQEVINESHEMSDGPSDNANYDRMSIDDDREDDEAGSRKRHRESTSPLSTHDLNQSQDTHPPRAKRLRMAKSCSPTRSSPSSTEQYGPGRDIFSALMDYLEQFR